MIKCDLFLGGKVGSIQQTNNMIHHIKKIKGKNHIIISTNAETHLTNPIPIFNKSSQQSGNRGNVPQHNKGHI